MFARRFQWLVVPVAAYLVITLVLPVLHGAARRADFFRHAWWVISGCAVVVAVAVAVGLVIEAFLRLTGRGKEEP